MTHHQPPGWAAVATIHDDHAPHQVRICSSGGLYWSCTCRARRGGGYEPLGNATGLTPDQILAAHAAHVAGAAA